MKIDSATLSKFLTLVNLSGEIEIKECILRGDVDKLSVIAITPSKIVIVRGQLMGDFSTIGDIGIDDLSLLKRMLTAFSGEIDLVVTTNKLKLSNKSTKVELVLRNPQYILNEVDKTKFSDIHKKSSGNEFTLTSENVREFQRYYGVFGKELLISGENQDITFDLANGDNSLNLTIEVAETINKFEVKLASLFMNILGTIATGVKLSINDGANAVLVSHNTDDVKIDYIVAPLMK
jgi:hypothetical protein